MSTTGTIDVVDQEGRPEGLQAWMELSEATSAMRTAVNRTLLQRFARIVGRDVEIFAYRRPVKIAEHAEC